MTFLTVYTFLKNNLITVFNLLHAKEVLRIDASHQIAKNWRNRRKQWKQRGMTR